MGRPPSILEEEQDLVVGHTVARARQLLHEIGGTPKALDVTLGVRGLLAHLRQFLAQLGATGAALLEDVHAAQKRIDKVDCLLGKLRDCTQKA